MPKKTNQKQQSKSKNKSKEKPEANVPEYEEEEEYEDNDDEEEEEEDLENNSFINNEEEISDEVGIIYRNDKVFQEQKAKMEQAKIKKEQGIKEDEDYKMDIKEEKDIKEEENDDSQKLGDSDLEIGQEYKSKIQKKKKRLHKKGNDRDKFKREMDNLKDDIIEDNDANRSMDEDYSENDIREDNEEESQSSNKYRRMKRREKFNRRDDNFIEYNKDIKEKIFPYEKQEVGIEELGQYISEEDKIISSADYPERLLTRYKIEELKNLSQEIKEEVEWIYEQKNYVEFPNKKKKITVLLELFKKDFLDIPYIINYRYYLFENDFQKKELWEIFELDAEYQKFLELKKKVMNNFNALEPYLNEKIFHNMKEKCIDNAKTIQDLNNMMNYINFNKDKYLPKEKEDDEFVGPVRRSAFNVSYNSELEKNAERFCLNSNDIASNLELIKNKESTSKLLHPPTPDIPLSVMCDSINIKNMSRTQIMENMCRLIAKEMMCHPYIKEYVYDYLRHICYVSTTPTEEGNKQLDFFNPSYRTKRIKERPILTFTDDLFLDVIQRAEEKLIDVNIFIKPDTESMNVFQGFFVKALDNEQNNNIEDDKYGLNTGIKREKDLDDDNDFNYSSSNKSEWSMLRENSIKRFFEFVQKQFLIDIKKELKEKAENYVINICGENFEKLLMDGPYLAKSNSEELRLNKNQNKKNKKDKKSKKNNSNEEDNEREEENEIIDETDLKFIDAELPRVIAFVFDPKDGITHSVALNENGEKIDQRSFNFNFNINFQGKSRSLLQGEDNLEPEQKRCRDFIEKNHPNLILIGANSLKCNQLKDLINNIVSNYYNNNERKINHYIYTAFGDLSIPELYANSSVSDSQVETKNMFIKQAISLGRYWQSPLHEILQLWSPEISENACLTIKLHPMQKYVNQRKLMDKLELKAVKVVNRVGFDINRDLEYSHRKNTLMFVSGFGPKKAKAFISNVNAVGKPQTREQMLEDIEYGIGKKLGMSFINFIKIKTNIKDAYSSSDIYNLLDMTRIPIDSYNIAKTLIDFVFKQEESNTNKKQKKSESDKIEEIIRHPDKLSILDINEYINKQREKLKSSEFEAFKFTIKLIKEELNSPFKDPRKEKIELNSQQILSLLIGDDNFRIGMITVAKVTRIDSEHIICKLQNGLDGSVWYHDIFEDGEKDPKEKMKALFKPGTPFQAKIKAIDPNKFKIDLSMKPNEMRTFKEQTPVEGISEFFEITEEDTLNMPYINAHSQKNLKYQPRNIKHDKFRNMTYTQCCNSLKNKSIGDCYFRPSSLGNNNLTLSYKFYNNIICHLDIVEEDKIHGENIGKKLKISNEVYSSLDEIVKRYVYPCAQLIKESTKSRKFVRCETKNDFDNLLKEDKKKNANIINYNYTILKDYPGYLVLGYVPKANPHYEYIKVKPKGLYFHEQYFNSLDDITNFFKKEYSTQKYRDYLNKTETPKVQYHQNIESNNVNNSSIHLDEQSENRFGRSSRFNNNSINMGSSFGKKDNLCHICKKPGHFARDCPEKNSGNFDRRKEGRDRNNYVGGKRFRDNRDNNDNRDNRDNRDRGFKKPRYDKGNNDYNNYNKNNNRDNNQDSWGMKQEKNNNDDAWDNAGDEWGNDNKEDSKNVKKEDDWGGPNNKDEWGDDNKKDTLGNKNNNDSWGNDKKESNWDIKKEDSWGMKKENEGWDENKNNVGGDEW